MIQLLTDRPEGAGSPFEPLDFERWDSSGRTHELDRRAAALYETDAEPSMIYASWIRYARQHPQRVFKLG